MDKVKVGVVGLGWVAQVFHIPALQKLKEAELVAVCDKDRGKARLVGEKIGVKRIYYDLRQMLQEEDMAAVIIATPTDTHVDTALAALAAGKDILVEKPIARTRSEAMEIARAGKETKRKVMVGMNHRFRPDTMILKSFIQANELGKIYFTRAGWLRKRVSDASWATQKEKSGGGVLLDLGIVMLDLALWMLGYPEVKRVSADAFKHRTKSVEDTALVSITLKDASRVHFEVSWTMSLDEDVYFCHVFGPEGNASLNPLRIHKDLNGTVANLAPTKQEPPQTYLRRSYENELRHFIGAIQERHPVVSTADEAVQRMKIVEAVYRSARLGKEIAIT